MTRYCNHLDVNYVTYPLAEDPSIYMTFLDWMKKTSKPKPFLSYELYWKRLHDLLVILF